MKDCLNPADQSVFYFKKLGDLPGPIDLLMIEKAESKDDASFTIYRFRILWISSAIRYSIERQFQSRPPLNTAAFIPLLS